MSWAMPTTGQWPAGMAMTPDMNMGNYTQEQWAALQQQNWQQWAQWQQQYAQWQTQYGEKYAQQMQAMQTMGGGMPPLPTVATAVAPPAPPPPENPPPPPPHENNQPLFGNTATQPTPVPAPNQRNASSGYNNSNFTGSNHNWSQAAPDSQQDTSQAVNADALKKLAEEERLFDIQFQKWEEEIEKWKTENVNHPDKEAYKEYEAKFEACRVQLLERRQQMKQRRAKLLGNTAQPAAAAPTGNNKTTPAIPSLMQMPVVKPPNFNTNVLSHQNIQPHQNTHSHQNNQAQNSQNQQTSRNYQNQNNTSYDDSQGYNNRSNNKNYDPHDRYEAYDTMEDYSKNDSRSSNFLPASASGKGIPGLDLVPESDKPTKAQVVIDVTGENARPAAPDYSTISQGINNILGDEKIMNILSMVRVTTAGGNINALNATSGPGGSGGPSGSMRPGVHAGQSGNFSPGGPSAGYGGPGGPSGGFGPNNANNYDNQNNQWNRNDNQYNNQQYSNRQTVPFNSQVPPPLIQQNMNQPGQSRMFHDNQRDMPQDQYYDRNNQGDPNMGGRPNMPPGRPPLQEMGGHQNMNDYRGSLDNSGLPDRDMYGNRGMPMNENRGPMNQPPPPRPKWMDDPLITPSIIVEYEHKPLRLKAREFIEPVHTFDYNHISKDDEYKKKDFEREVDDLFTRKPRRLDDAERDRFMERPERYPTDRGERFRENRDLERPPRDFERRPREEIKDDFRPRVPPRDEYEDRRRTDSMYYDRRRDDRDRRSPRRDDHRDREEYRSRDDHRDREEYRSRDDHRDRDRDRYSRDSRRDDVRVRSRSRDRDLRKRARSKESELSEHSKKSKESEKVDSPKHVVMIDDILEEPGRDMRPRKIVIILRGPPGSGKSYLAKLIRDREAEHGGTARIMSIDDYFMQEGEVEEKDHNTGKIVKKPIMKYEYDEKLEETYVNSLKRAFKRSLTDGYFSFLIYDAVNDQLKSYADMWNFARQSGFQVYTVTMDLDPLVCFKRNIHNRSLSDIEVVCSRFSPTPAHHIELDASTLLQAADIADVHMEDAGDQVAVDAGDQEVETSFTSKWEKMDDIDKLARLDGTSKPLRPSQLSMEDYLQIDEWKPTQAKPGKKTVRWADIEERRQQEKMRAIGFVVGQTDWNRMTDPTMGSSALTQTKYIERVKRK